MNPWNWFVWAFFKNDDDPEPRYDLWVDRPEWQRKFLWWLRNPAHNFTHYVIGLKGRRFSSEMWGVWGPFELMRRRLWSAPWIPFLCLYYEGKRMDGYIGWRTSGAFGIALRRRRK